MTNCKTDMSLYVKDISRYPLLSREEEVVLAAKIKEGDTEAKNRLVCCNTRLVLSIAKKFRVDGLETDDLVAAGNFGLEKAARDYDPERGTRFATYAVWWVKQYMHVAIKERYLVHVPTYCQELLLHPERTYRKASRKCLEAAAKTLRADRGHPLVVDGQVVDAVDVLPAPDETNTMEHREQRELMERQAYGMLESLTQRGREVVRLRLWEGLSLRDVGEMIGMSKERVRQLQNAAYRRLREHAQQTA